MTVQPWTGFHDPYDSSPAGQYWTRLAERCARWAEKHPEEYEALWRSGRTQCQIPEAMPDEKIPPGRRQVLDALIGEWIRRQMGWPTELEYRQTQHSA